MEATLGNLAADLTSHGFPAEVEGDQNRVIHGIATLDDANEGELSFLSNPKYIKQLETTRASAVICKPEVTAPARLNLLRTADPYAAVTVLLVRHYGYRAHRRVAPGTNGGFVAESAQLGENVSVYPGATIEENAVVGPGSVLYPGVFIGPRCRIGENAVLYPNVVIYDDCILGDRVTIHAGTVIGNDGLGYAPVDGKWVKIPQVGIVEIGDDVEIGSNCSIDRATLGKTRIGRGTKFSNLIAIGHGSQIGEDCMFVAHVGLAGSVTVGNHVTIAGQAGVVGHIRVGDHATIGARSGVINNVGDGETVLGEPAIPINDMKRQVAYLQKLPEMAKTIKQLQKQLEQRDAPDRGDR